jgi:type I restriction enzyme S subunit
MNWPTVTLRKICEFRYGKSLPDKTRVPGSYAVYGSNGTVGSHEEALTQGDTIIVGRKGSIGEVNYSPSPCWPIDTTYYIDKTATRENLKWLTYTLKGLGLDRLNKATGVPGLNRNDAYEKRLVLPPLNEQKRIVAILDQADNLRRLRQRTIDHLITLRQSIFYKMFEEPAVSKQFKASPLTDFFDFRTGKLDSNAAIKDGAYPFFTCSREDFKINDYAFDCEALLLAGNNASADYSVKHYAGKFNAYQRTYVLTLSDKSNSYVYAKEALERKLSELKFASKGSNTKYLTMSIFREMKIPVPSYELQDKFAAKLKSLMALAASFNSDLTKLNSLYSSLQHRAFRGEL